MSKVEKKLPEILTGVVMDADGAVTSRNELKLCKVIQTLPDGVAGVDFDGYGIQVKPNNECKVGDMIEVKYVGKIGSKDFKCWAVK